MVTEEAIEEHLVAILKADQADVLLERILLLHEARMDPLDLTVETADPIRQESLEPEGPPLLVVEGGAAVVLGMVQEGRATLGHLDDAFARFAVPQLSLMLASPGFSRPPRPALILAAELGRWCRRLGLGGKGVSAPGVSAPDISAPDISAPGVAALGIAALGVGPWRCHARPMRAGQATRFRRIAVSVAALLVCCGASALQAYETDQYTARNLELADAVDLLNGEVNRALVEIAAGWRGDPDPRRFARLVYKRLGGRHWVDRLERWAVRSEKIDKFHPRRRGNIYSGLPLRARRVSFLFGIGPTIRVHRVLIGTDKLGHFLSQGWKYHKRFLRSRSTEHAVRLGTRNEASIFGSPATGSFSNADLVANYEGLRFYRSLFEDGIVGDRSAIVEWRDGGASIARRFDFRDHVNDFWDEALNPNRYDRWLRRPMLDRLRLLCPKYDADPEVWVSEHDLELRQGYALLGLRDGTSHRLDRVCSEGPPEAGARARVAAPAMNH